LKEPRDAGLFYCPRKAEWRRSYEMRFCDPLQQPIRKLDLINVEFDPGIADVERDDLFNKVFFVVIEYLHVKITDQVQIYLVTIIPDAHNKHTILVQRLQLLVK
jgi:hypothetical protein